MQFDPNNNIMKLCANGMEMEGKGMVENARRLFLQAWNESTTDFERLTAAHYVARHQKSISDKLKWDEEALRFALKIEDAMIEATLPSLYLNIAKCHEDLSDRSIAKQNYELALSYSQFLPDDGYGKMIKSGIISGLDRVK